MGDEYDILGEDKCAYPHTFKPILSHPIHTHQGMGNRWGDGGMDGDGWGWGDGMVRIKRNGMEWVGEESEDGILGLGLGLGLGLVG